MNDKKTSLPVLNKNGDVKGVWVKKGVDAKRKQFYSDSPGYYQLYESSSSELSVWAFTWVLEENKPLSDHLSYCTSEEASKLNERVNRI